MPAPTSSTAWRLLLIDKNSNKASMSFATADTTLSGFGTCTNK
jgi:hypothetical protein